MPYTKNGSFPSEKTDGSSGWSEVLPKPDTPEGKEVVWLNFEWTVRDPKPEDRIGYQWNWNHNQKTWVEYPLANFQEILDVNTTSEINIFND